MEKEFHIVIEPELLELDFIEDLPRLAAYVEARGEARPAPESCHAIAQVIREAGHFQQAGEAATIAFCLSGTGYLDLQGYANTFQFAVACDNAR